MNIYDGTTLVGNLSDYTTSFNEDDIETATSLQGGLEYIVSLGSGENIKAEDSAGNLIAKFDGGIISTEDGLKPEWGFTTSSGAMFINSFDNDLFVMVQY